MKGLRDAALGLLIKAQHDLHNADTVLPTGAALDTVLFHAQQAAEKCLKALLVLQDVNYPLTHDVDELLRMALLYYPELEAFSARTGVYVAYSVTGRYDAATYPSADETEAGVRLAHEIYDYTVTTIGE